MKRYNCIAILNRNRDRILFCKRISEPYTGLYNFVGGKIEEGESFLDAAYRELEEETGISRSDTSLIPLMDFIWHIQQIHMEVYVGVLNKDVVLREEKHPLQWIDFSYNFFDTKMFAGEGNIGHMIEIMKDASIIK